MRGSSVFAVGLKVRFSVDRPCICSVCGAAEESKRVGSWLVAKNFALCFVIFSRSASSGVKQDQETQNHKIRHQNVVSATSRPPSSCPVEDAVFAPNVSSNESGVD